MMPWLSESELYELTRKRYAAWQARALKAMGIPYVQRQDGSLVVMRADMTLDPQRNHRRTEGPRLDQA